MNAPLTERILNRLPGPRWLWIGLWVVLPVAVLSEAVRRDPSPTFPGWMFVMAFVYGVLASFPGIRWLAASAASLQPLVDDLTNRARNPFGAIARTDGPLFFTLGMVVAFPLVNYLQDPRLSTAVAVGVVGLLGMPFATLVWTIGSTFLGLTRLGGIPLRLHAFESDPSLGLQPLGVLAFRTVIIYVLISLPATVTGTQSLRDGVFNLGTYVVVFLLFFGSLWGLRRQLLTEKARHVAWARARYAHAFSAVRNATSPAAVREFAPELEVAESFERRAEGVQEWPFDDRIFRTLAAVFSTILTAIIVRLILAQIGL